MKRTTIYLAPDLEVLLKLETQRSKRPMAEVVREAVRAYVARPLRGGPPGAGAFASGTADTAHDVDEALTQTGFGGHASSRPKRPTASKPRTRRPAPARSRPR